MLVPRAHLWKLGVILTMRILACAVALVQPNVSSAYQRSKDATGKADPPSEQAVTIKRDAVRLTDPKIYRVSMHLQAARSLNLTAPADGYVRTISAKPQQKLAQQAEVMRFDEQRSALVLKRAKAHVQAAQVEKKLAQSKGDTHQAALAEAHLDAAQADLELAQMDADQLVIRAPFGGEIERVYAVEGQFVRAGERLATLIDPSKLVVEIPVERSTATPGSFVNLKVEETAASATVESIVALSSQFDPLRELTNSPASALVSIDNARGQLSPGQTVYSDLIPQAPVTLVPSIAISNTSDGKRKVQVLRENVIRDLTVRILGKVGTDSVFVSGRFVEGDEVIVSSTRALTDGTPLRALQAGTGTVGTGAGAAKGAGSRPAAGKKESTPAF
ncbi:MAG: HlyD family efflux transporter periplasmic adaptor subunit [Planctomycetaceae bacterium]|nr:HlyD family efflux transporter periplasmic adaptor subunit [Planctomycetaceae bacterium]